jgi:hypothetical protein
MAFISLRPEMPNLFRTIDGTLRKPSVPIPLQLADGTIVEGTWAGSATAEKLDWWLRPAAGSRLAQSEEVTAIAAKADDNGEIVWGDAPPGARLLFVLEPAPPGKDYRLAKLVTTASTPAQLAWFRHERASLFGRLKADGSIEKISPLVPPPPVAPAPPAQGELF